MSQMFEQAVIYKEGFNFLDPQDSAPSITQSPKDPSLKRCIYKYENGYDDQKNESRYYEETIFYPIAESKGQASDAVNEQCPEVVAVSSCNYDAVYQTLAELIQTIQLPRTRNILRAMLTQAIISFIRPHAEWSQQVTVGDKQQTKSSVNKENLNNITKEILIACFAAGYNILKEYSLAAIITVNDRNPNTGTVKFISFLELAYWYSFYYALDTFHHLGHAPLSKHTTQDDLERLSRRSTKACHMIYFQTISAHNEQTILQKIVTAEDDSYGNATSLERLTVAKALMLYSKSYDHGRFGGTNRIADLFEQLFGVPVGVASAEAKEVSTESAEETDNAKLKQANRKACYIGHEILTKVDAAAKEYAKTFKAQLRAYARAEPAAIAERRKHQAFRAEELRLHEISDHLVATPTKVKQPKPPKQDSGGVSDGTQEYKQQAETELNLSRTKIRAVIRAADQLHDLYLANLPAAGTVEKQNEQIIGQEVWDYTSARTISILEALSKPRNKPKPTTTATGASTDQVASAPAATTKPKQTISAQLLKSIMPVPAKLDESAGIIPICKIRCLRNKPGGTSSSSA